MITCLSKSLEPILISTIQRPSTCRDTDGAMWFGTRGGGISRYDGHGFINFTTSDGLASGTIFGNTILQAQDGTMWIGTHGGISRFDGQTFRNFTTADGLGDDGVHAVFQDWDGAIWVAIHGGISRYDGGKFTNFTEGNGLARGLALAIFQDRDGVMWFGTSEGKAIGGGMPPLYICWTSGQIEGVVIEGLPLGAMQGQSINRPPFGWRNQIA